MTVPIARLVGDPLRRRPSRRCASATSRNAYRAVRPHRGQMREFLQAGIELVGAPGPEGTAEALTVLCRALDATGLRGFRIGLGDASLYPALLEAFGVPRTARERLLHELASRDFVGLEREVARARPRRGRGEDADRVAAAARRRRRCSTAPAAGRATPSTGLREVVALLDEDIAARVIVDLGRAPRPRLLHGRRCSRSTTPSSASRSAAAAATTSCSAASAGRCRRSASRSASTSCTPRWPARSAAAPSARRFGLTIAVPARRAARRDARRARRRSASTPPRSARTTASCSSRTSASSRCARPTCRPTSRPAPPTSASPARTS